MKILISGPVLVNRLTIATTFPDMYAEVNNHAATWYLSVDNSLFVLNTVEPR